MLKLTSKHLYLRTLVFPRKCWPRCSVLLVAFAFFALSCEATSAGCPDAVVTVPVYFSGDVKGMGEIRLIPERRGAIRVEGTLSRETEVIMKIAGPGACSGGVIGATFHGVSPSQKGVKVEEGKFAAVFEPRPLGGRLVGGWDAALVYNNGVTHPISGFVRDGRDGSMPPKANESQK